MKRISTPSNWLAPAIAGLAFAFATSSGLAVPDRELGTFDNGTSGTGWLWGIGWGTSTIEWDGSQDNTGNGGGSLHAYGSFDRATSDTPLMLYGILSGNPWYHPDPSYDLSVYKTLEFDIKWDGSAGNMSLADFNSPAGGGVTGLEIHACPDNPGGAILATTNIPAAAASGWTHMSIPINPAQSGLGAVYGIYMNKWLQPVTNPPASFGFWIDNVVLKGGDVLPPPTVSLGNKPVPGLAFIAASSGQYDRQEIRTVGSNYAWYGSSGPVSYSVDVAKIGENAPAPTGFTLFMHFVPGIPNPTDGGSDYGEPNVLMWTIANSADGSAWSQLRYKTNASASNGHMFDTGTLTGGPWNPTPAGTWTITFSQDTNIVITAPTGGAVTNILPPEVVDIFKNYSPNMQINVGGVPGDPSRFGQMAVVTRVRFTGVPGEPNVDSDFLAQPRDTNVWNIVASSANFGVQQIPTDAAYWVNWTLPANGFSLEMKSALGAGPWTSPAITGWEVAGFNHVLLRQSDLPGVNSGYFRLTKRVATQLQVLLPGETNAPGTVTGKIGTPEAQATGIPFDLRINACDPNWHIVTSCVDAVAITSSDTSAWLPSNASLANGTATITGNFFFASSGTWTITATDVTAPAAISPGTSSSIVIP